jgi:hypothetical protein
MRIWDLKLSDPNVLTLSADPRLNPTEYTNDHIWELCHGSGEPLSLSIQTTYGLRARSMRIFPRFILQDTIQTDPAMFAGSVKILNFYPNFLHLSCKPYAVINAEIEYWVPTSQSLAGRTKLTNTGSAPLSIRLEWIPLLNPNSGGQRMVLDIIGITQVLSGKTGNLAPTFYLTGVVQAGGGPYFSLASTVELKAGETRTITWAQVASTNPEASFELAKELAVCNWDAERARIELTNTDQLEIYTGNPDWDAALALTQKTARGLIHTGQAGCSNPSSVSNRLPDQGYSIRGDGNDYTHLWDGQTPYDLYYLLGLLLPGGSQLVRGFLENFFATQTTNGDIDWKPGLSGQRGQLTAPPMLAGITLQYYQMTGNQEFIIKNFPHLLAFVLSWFSPLHDRDGDGIPEWDHAIQNGFDDHPIFAHWHSWSQGLEITRVEGPDLCAFLYKDIRALIQLAHDANRFETISPLESLAEHLRMAVEASWNDESSTYQYWDRESHYSSPLEILGSRQGSGIIQLRSQFPQPVRLVIRLDSNAETSPPALGFIHGTGPSGGHRIERISPERFRWQLGIGLTTSERVYTGLEHIEIQGIHDDDQITVQTAGLNCRDQSLLLPLWAGIPSPSRAKQLIKNTLTNPRVFWSTYGVRACAENPANPESANHYQRIHPLWNSLIGEGLLRYNQPQRAADLFTRLMNSIIPNLKQDACFFRSYLASNGHGQGEHNSLLGLAPLGFFMQVLGIQILSQWKVKISGSNPFPWPVTVKFRGLTVIQQKKNVMIIFPDGQNITLRNNKPLLVSGQ